MKKTVLVAAVIFSGFLPFCRGEDVVPSLQVAMLQTASGVHYGVLGEKPQQPAPTLFVFAGTIGLSLGQENSYYFQSGKVLSKQGYLCVSVDLPCHGTQQRTGEPEGLAGWRYRLDRGEDFVAETNRQLVAVLDDLIRRQYTDPKRVAACGVSRGAFIAGQFAAVESRVGAVALFSPVTDLAALTEFQGADRQRLRSLGLAQQVDPLIDRALFIVIGDRDQRVDTDAAIRFAREVSRAAVTAEQPGRAELYVLPEPNGHSVPDAQQTFDRAAHWIDRQLTK